MGTNPGTHSDLFFYPDELVFMYRGGLHFITQTAKLFHMARWVHSIGSAMPILIVSANPLFKEVINEIVAHVQPETVEINCEEALTRICELKPDVMIIDKTISPPYFEGILAEARKLERTRTIVLNPVQNEILILDSRRATLKKVDELMEAISNYEYEIDTEINDDDLS